MDQPSPKPSRVRRSDLTALIEENERLVDLLRRWPARKILMEYEQDWDAERRALLESRRPHGIDLLP